MLLVTVAVTVVVALVLFPEPQRSPSFVLSLVMLCVAETTLFAFPMYHAGSDGDRASPAFIFGLGFQATLGLYAAGVVALCLVAGGGEVSFRTLAILHAVWATALLLVSGFWR